MRLESELSFPGDKREHGVCGCVCVRLCMRKRGGREEAPAGTMRRQLISPQHSGFT